MSASFPVRVFIGYDPKETVAYHVLAHSILRQASMPVSITPISRTTLARVYSRERLPNESTEFSISRFLVPYLCDYDGIGIFLDCDMLVQADIYELFAHGVANPDMAVLCCQHDYTPSSGVKFLGQPQAVYPRKNWSSVMVFNAQHCRALTPAYVNTASGLDLHRFHWTTDDQIGALPLDWNWLVGEYGPHAEAKNLHWTLGGPWFSDYALAPHAERWYAERDRMLKAA